MSVLPFKAPERLEIVAVMCRGVGDPPSALRREFWLVFHDTAGGQTIVHDGATYFGALEAADLWARDGVRIIDRIGCGGRHA